MSPAFDHVLRGFVAGGVALILAAWLITGNSAVALGGLVPFAALAAIWLGTRGEKRAEGQDNAG